MKALGYLYRPIYSSNGSLVQSYRNLTIIERIFNKTGIICIYTDEKSNKYHVDYYSDLLENGWKYSNSPKHLSDSEIYQLKEIVL